MAISNKTGAMVVTTGNKSEMSVGYATIYGDMNGGFNPIKDIYKTEVFRLSSLRNAWKPDGALGPSGEVIPVNIITRPPTAELRENQTDQDSLPPYDMLDAHPGTAGRARGAAGRRSSPPASTGDVVTRIDRLLNIAEYKRRQAAPGVKVTEKNFGRDRRYPITNRFRDTGKALPEPDEKLVVARRPRVGGSVRGVKRLVLLRRDEGRADRADRLVLSGGGGGRIGRGRRVAARRGGGAGGRCALLGGGRWRRALRLRALLHLLRALLGDDDVASVRRRPCRRPTFSASDQVWPAALQAQDGLNSVRYLNAFGSDE